MKKSVLTAALVLLASVTSQRLLAVQNCVTQDFKGTYGIVAHGAVTVPGFPITGPFARAGQVVADGNGKLVFNTTASYNGILFSEAINATYTMSPDCSMVFTVEPFAPIYQLATFNALLSDNKRQVDFMITVPGGQVISAVLKKQEAQACTVRDFSGPYGLHMTGSVIVPPEGLQAGPFVRAGKIVPDGMGGFFADTHANYGGLVIRPEAFSGTYTVNKDCTVSLQYTYENVPYLWSGAIVENGKGVDLVVGAAGFAIAGELKKQ